MQPILGLITAVLGPCNDYGVQLLFAKKKI